MVDRLARGIDHINQTFQAKMDQKEREVPSVQSVCSAENGCILGRELKGKLRVTGSEPIKRPIFPTDIQGLPHHIDLATLLKR